MNRIKARAKGLEPMLRIGKNGLSDAMIKEIRSQLDKKVLIKIKLLKSYASGKSSRELALQISKRVDAVLVESVGNIIVLQKGKTIYKP
ncbi:YhbY family RNA-binding protein [Candidatus Woesearchaeota archaeon]|nr:YhbY family RNA-binding protein [Candidatus Woesearchaeota archaeon]